MGCNTAGGFLVACIKTSVVKGRITIDDKARHHGADAAKNAALTILLAGAVVP